MPRPLEDARPHKVRGFWWLVRRVPREFVAFDERRMVRLSTGVRIADDPRGVTAAKVVRRLDAELVQYWKDKRRGRNRDAEIRYEQACQRARSLSLTYMPAPELVSSLPFADILGRFEILARRRTADSAPEVAAVLGGVPAPRLMVADMLDEYEQIVRAALTKKSERQRKKWRASKELALGVFVEVVGNRSLASLTRTDVMKFRSHWQDRVVEGSIEIGTANKYIGHVSSMYRAIVESRQLDLPAIFDRARISGGKDGQRLAYAPAFVQERFLADGVFADINSEARRIIYLLIETGLRLSEAINLSRATIRLDAPIPHVCVLPDGRDLKTDQSEREIPLVGVALMAMREHTDGFPRYRDKADSLSALVNKALEARALRPQVGHSLYSLRHTFEDRLTAVNAPDKIIACLMGHKWSRPRYGVGPSLELKREWLDRIAFRPPLIV